MDLNQQKEKFSDAYLQAIAAVAGYGLARPNPDTDSVDWVISARSTGNLLRRPRLEVQLKCSAQDIVRDTHLAFPLKLKNYNDLRHTDPVVPIILVVVTVPDNIADWITQTETELVMRRCGYWVSLKGQPETANESEVTVRLPRVQTFTPDVLAYLMQRINDKEEL